MFTVSNTQGSTVRQPHSTRPTAFSILRQHSCGGRIRLSSTVRTIRTKTLQIRRARLGGFALRCCYSPYGSSVDCHSSKVCLPWYFPAHLYVTPYVCFPPTVRSKAHSLSLQDFASHWEGLIAPLCSECSIYHVNRLFPHYLGNACFFLS